MSTPDYSAHGRWAIVFEGDHHHVYCGLAGDVKVDHDEFTGDSVIHIDESDAGEILSCLLANWHKLYKDHR